MQNLEHYGISSRHRRCDAPHGKPRRNRRHSRAEKRELNDYLNPRVLSPKMTAEERRSSESEYFYGTIVLRLQDDVSDEAMFNSLFKAWRDETGGFSLARQKQFHPTYLRMIGMGEKAVQWLLELIAQRRRHLFLALESITGENPASSASTFEEACLAWVDWGREKMLL